MNTTSKKILLFGFIAVLLAGIPLTMYVLKTQQETRSQAEKSTTLSFLPESSEASPIRKQVGDEFPIDVQVNPGENLVSFVRMEIQYDPTKLATSSAGDAFKINEAAFPVTLEGPSFESGRIAITLSIGSDPTNAVQTTTSAVTIKFRALANTNGVPTNITYSNNTEVLSAGDNDQASENVLLNMNPAVIVIGDSDVTPTDPTDTPTGIPPTAIPPTAIPPTGVPPTAIPPTGVPPAQNQAPLCSSINIDRPSTGPAPHSVTYTVVGTDADGTISRVIFNYGDGPAETVTQTGGIGSNTVNVQRAHTYTNPGTYQASAILSDNSGALSDQNACKTTIVVLPAPTNAGGQQGGLTPYPSATMDPNQGPGDVFIGLGAAAALITIIGGFLFFAL